MFHFCRSRAAGKANAAGVKKSRPRDRGGRGISVPDSNAELQANIDVCQIRHIIHLHKYFCLSEYFIPLIDKSNCRKLRPLVAFISLKYS